MASRVRHLRYTALVVGAVLVWALSFPLIKLALRAVSPIMLALCRNLIFLPLVVWLFLSHGKDAFRHDTRTWARILGISVFGIALPNIFQNIGMLYTSASVSSLIQSSGPIFAIVLAVIFLDEKYNVNRLVGTTLALLGVVLLVTEGGKVEFAGTVKGNVLLLLSTLCYPVAGVLAKKSLQHTKPFVLLTHVIAVGFCMLLPAVPAFGENLVIAREFALDTWLIIAALALFPTFLAPLVWYKVLARTELSKLVVFVYLMPVFAIAFSCLMLPAEKLDPFTIALGALVVLGVALAQK